MHPLLAVIALILVILGLLFAFGHDLKDLDVKGPSVVRVAVEKAHHTSVAPTISLAA